MNIFWDCKDGSRGGKLTLPLDSSNDNPNTKIRQFVADCEPAGFGRGQEAVMDPTYRKAGKLDTDHFMTSFHPADFGIIGNVEQVLCANLSAPNENTEDGQSALSRALSQRNLTFRRIRPDFYKLNVCYSLGVFSSY